MMISLKRFRGVQQSLSMTGTGILVALDCFRNARTEPFMEALDAQILEFGAQPNLSKDSRLPGSIARQALPGWVEFEQALHRYDKDRLMRSELSRPSRATMTYLVVGASSGLGRALAERFASAGNELVLVSRDRRDTEALSAHLAILHGVKVSPVTIDSGQ